MMADRESAEAAPIDVQAVTWYGFAEEVIDNWAEQFVQLANTPVTQQVEDSSAFRLNPCLCLCLAKRPAGSGAVRPLHLAPGGYRPARRAIRNAT